MRYLIIFLIVGFLLYANTLQGSFVFDDYATVVNNEYIKNLFDPIAIWYSSPTRFVSNLSFAINYQISGLRTFDYHLFNLIIHIFNTYLVFKLSSFFMKKVSLFRLSIPLIVALIFLTHPIQTQAVSYITQRMASLAAFFYLSSLYSFVLFTSNKGSTRIILYLLSLLFALFGFFTKENTFTLPIAILLVDYFFIPKIDKVFIKRFRNSFPFFILAGVSYYITTHAVWGPSPFQIVYSHLITIRNPVESFHYFYTQLRVIPDYMQLLLLPLSQNIDYNIILQTNFFRWETILYFLFLLIVILIAIKIRKKYPLISFGILFFFVTLAIESSFLPIDDLKQEYRLYLPSVGFFLAFVSFIVLIFDKVSKIFHKSTFVFYPLRRFKASYLLLVVYLLFLSTLTIKRNFVWQSEFALWTDTVKKSPMKARPHYNLGIVYWNEKKYDSAKTEFLQAASLDPKMVEAYRNLGIAYDKEGNSTKAEQYFQYAIELDPENVEAYNNLGQLYIRTAKYDDAIGILTKAARIAPAFTNIYFNLATAYYKNGDIDGAIRSYEILTRLNPSDGLAYYVLGTFYEEKVEFDHAIVYYQKALHVLPSLSMANDRIQALQMK